MKLGKPVDDSLCKRSDAVAELARATTLEGHYTRILTGKKPKAELKSSLEKYCLRYAQVKPDMVQATIRAECETVMRK